MRRWLLLLAIAVVLAAPQVFAGETESHTVTVANNGLTDFYATLNIPQFDPAKGELLKVSLDVAGTLDGYFYYENLSAGPGGYQVLENTWNFVADLQGTSLVSDTGAMSTLRVILTGFDGIEDYTGASGATVPYSDTTSGSRAYLSADTGFVGFQGTATLPLSVATTIWTSYSAYGGHSISGLHTDASWTATVTYEYAPPALPAGDMTWGGVKGLYSR